MRAYPALPSWTIRRRLLLLLLVISLPACAIIIYSSIEKRDEEIESAKHQALIVAQSLAAQVDDISWATRQMLGTLAQMPQVRQMDRDACNRLFSELKSQNPHYASIAASNPAGEVFAASNTFPPGGIHLHDRKYVRDLVEKMEFSAGEYVIGRGTNLRSIHFGYPVADSGGKLVAILLAGFNLDGFANFVDSTILPEGYAVIVADHAGVLLFRSPENNEAAPGKPLPEDTFQKISGPLVQGTFERIGQDGVLRVYAFKQLSLKDGVEPYLYVLAGISKERILEKANNEMLRNLSFLGFSLLFAVLAALAVGNFTLVWPIEALCAAVRRFAGGEMGVRTGLPHNNSELGQLARSFDEMASLLEKKDADRIKAEDALRHSEEKYRTLIETTDTGYLIFDSQGKVLDANAEYVRLSGHNSLDQILGRKLTDWTADYHRELNISELEKFFETGATRNLEIDYVSESGAITPVDVFASVMRTENGPVGLALCRDISFRRNKRRELLRAYDEMEMKVAKRTAELSKTNALLRTEIEERSRTELALRESEKRFKDMADCLSQPVFEMDSDGYFTFLNKAGYNHLGYTEKDLLAGLHYLKIIAPGKRDEVEKIFIRLIFGNVPSSFETTLMSRDGTMFPVAFFPSAIYASKEIKGVRGAFFDLTERIVIENERLRTQKLESLEILAGGIAHDFNNLLSVIIGNAELLAILLKDQSCRNFADNVLKVSLQARELSKEFLLLSESGAPVKVQQSVGDFIMEILESNHGDPFYEFEARIDADVPHCEFDASQIQRVIMCLIQNAKEAMPEGGTIEIQAAYEERLIPLRNMNPGCYACISIKDHGMGIPMEYYRKIFDPYFSTKERGEQKGMGLGLAVAQTIIKRHGGDISFDSQAGIGSIFHVFLPALRPN